MVDTSTKSWFGALAGGIVAGLGITALLMAGERESGEPSELAKLERAAAGKLGLDTPPADQLPSAGKQAVIQGGQIALGLLAAAAYAASTDEDTPVVATGLTFGAAFYVAMHWLVGPALGVKQPEWRADRATLAMHTINHLVFGLATAAMARAAQRA